jgi:hypothetical protein
VYIISIIGHVTWAAKTFSQSIAQAKATKKVEEYPPQTAPFIVYHELAERFPSPSTTAILPSFINQFLELFLN